MRQQPIILLASIFTSTAFLLTATSPAVFADTTPTPTQDVTNLATITTTVAGQSDPLFANLEQPYQSPLTSNTGWTGFCRQGGRYITLQFPQYVDVTKIQFTVEQDPVKGIYFPKQVNYQAASYGQWYSLGAQVSTATPSSLPTNRQPISTQTFTFNSSGFTTNAIQIEIPVAVWVFVNNLHVYGSTTVTGQGLNSLGYKLVGSSQSSGSSQNTGTGALTPNSPNAYGIHNMLLVQTGQYKNLGTWSAADFGPMLGYVNDSGYMDAPLFDTMLFLPYSNAIDTQAYWTRYLNDLFSTNTQLGALNQEVAATNQTLNRTGYKEKVVLTIPYLPYGAKAFGSINGQNINFGGTAADPDAINARAAALNWYISTLLSKWKTANYQNLQLVGLYWDEEQYKVNAPAEKALLDTAEGIAKQNNLPLFWIPFYGASGSNEWSKLGFNAAWIQSNYIEQGANATVSRITSTMSEASQYGMGMEVELTNLNSATEPLYQTFLQTLSSNSFGGNLVSHAYYDGSKLLLDAEQSTDPNVRKFYDQTAWFIMVGSNN
jgi:hypothetical protein